MSRDSNNKWFIITINSQKWKKKLFNKTLIFSSKLYWIIYWCYFKKISNILFAYKTNKTNILKSKKKNIVCIIIRKYKKSWIKNQMFNWIIDELIVKLNEKICLFLMKTNRVKNVIFSCLLLFRFLKYVDVVFWWFFFIY